MARTVVAGAETLVPHGVDLDGLRAAASRCTGCGLYRDATQTVFGDGAPHARVKHFKFTRDARGKRRIHQKPSRTEVVACRPWLLAELDLVRPELVIALGATAAQSLLGASFRLTRHRGEVLDAPELDARVLAAIHPSAVLRAPDRDAAYGELLADLRVAAGELAASAQR